MLEELVARGRADARSWAEQSGVAALAAAARAGGAKGAAAAAGALRPAGGGSLVLP
jgi:hypothetical protein